MFMSFGGKCFAEETVSTCFGMLHFYEVWSLALVPGWEAVS